MVSVINIEYLKKHLKKISNIFDKTLVLSINCGKCGSNDKKVYKEEESIEILKILGWIKYIKKYQTNIIILKKKMDEELMKQGIT